MLLVSVASLLCYFVLHCKQVNDSMWPLVMLKFHLLYPNLGAFLSHSDYCGLIYPILRPSDLTLSIHLSPAVRCRCQINSSLHISGIVQLEEICQFIY